MEIKFFQLNKTNIIFGFVALIGIAQFAYAVGYGMSHYPDGYSISEHFLSDLGTTRTRDGTANPHAALFNRAVIILGITLIGFFLVIPWSLQKLSWVVGISGALSGLGLIFIGLTPFDLHFVEHHLALGLWLAPMLVLVVSFLCSLLSGGEKGFWVLSIVSIISLALVIAIGAYAANDQRTGHVVFQKIVAVFSVAWFVVVFVSVSFSTYYYAASNRLVKIEQQANDYMQVLRRGHRKR